MRVLALCLLLSLALLAVASLPVTHAHGEVDDNPLALINPANIVEDIKGGAIIKIEAAVLKGQQQKATISWSGMPTGDGHWIGVYNPRPADFKTALPQKYFKIVRPGPTGARGINFLNQRHPVTVAYFTGSLTDPTLIAASEPVPWENYNEHMQVHLSLTAFPDQMRVSWTNNNGSEAHPLVAWGKAPGALTATAPANTTTYTEAMMCGAPAKGPGFMAPGQLHTAVMSGLAPNTEYFYQLRDDSGLHSEVISFWSAPAPKSDTDFFVFGDLGQSESDGTMEHSQMHTSLTTIAGMQHDLNTNKIQVSKGAAVFHIGDISYARGYAGMWETWFAQVQNISRSSAWMTVNGNHERDYPKSGSLYTGKDSGGECGVPTNHRFNMPHEHIENIDEQWWSVNHGSTHWVILSTEHEFKKGSPQWEFVAADLAKVDRAKTPFLILAGHRPMYAWDMMDSIAGALRDAYEPLMQQHKVDVAFWGHQHTYQRTCALHGIKCVSENTGAGTIHFVSGAPGAGMSPAPFKDRPDWVAYAEKTNHGYVRGNVRGDSLTLEFVHNDKPDVVVDSVVIASKFKNGKFIGDAATKPKPAVKKHQHKKHK